MKKLVLIDGNSLLNRAFYATPAFTTKSGMPTNAIFGFVKLTFKILDDVKPDYIAVAFDMKAPTFRHKMYSGYKANRKPMPDALAVQVEPLKSLLKAMGIAICGIEGIEADDIIGTLSKKFEGVHSYIFTGDRDSYQLVDEHTDVCFTKQGVSDLQKLTAKNFKQQTGLEPPQIVDLKSIQGDKSDNIPGVPGIGEKTAMDLLGKYATLDGVYDHLDELKPSAAEKFKSNKDLAYLSYKLATIDTHCDVPLGLEDCVVPQKYNAEVRKLFEDFEFKSFLSLDIFSEEVKSASKAIDYPERVEYTDKGEILDIISKNRKFAAVLGKEEIQFYTGGKLYNVTIGGDLINGIMFEDLKEIVAAIVSNPENKVIAHDFKQMMHLCEEHFGVEVNCDFDDLSLAVYLCDFGLSDMDLKSLVEYYLYDYSYSAFAVFDLFSRYFENLEKENLISLYSEIEKPLLKVLYDMEKTGVMVSVKRLDELSKAFYRQTEDYRAKIFEQCGCEFNLNSPQKLAETLYNKLGITEIKKKKTGKFTTSAEVLEKIVDKYPVVSDILKYRMYQKLSATYAEGLRPLIDKKTGLIHTTFHQTLTTTGRLSSSDPNLQNIPIREEEGRELRKMFIPHEGNVFIDADYSQIELRLLAHFSGCKELIEAYNNGVDVHSVTASQVFGVPVDEVTPKQRREAKAVNFGIIYGISDFGLARNLNIPVPTAKEYIEKYFERYSAVKDYMNSNVEFAKKHGYVSTLSGRKRVIPEINSSNFNLRQFGERAAMNMPLQGSSADIIKIAMINVAKALRDEGLRAKLILQVHDELVLESPKEESERAAEILKREMENAVQLKVPLTVEAHIGNDWYEAK